MKSKTKQPHKKPAGTPKVADAHTWLGRLLLMLALLLAAGATWALFVLVIWNKVPGELVGKWVVVAPNDPQDGATFDFFRNGTMMGKVNVHGKEGIINATIRVEGKNMYSTTRHPQTGRPGTRVQVIRTLTAKELVVEDEQGGLMRMERAE